MYCFMNTVVRCIQSRLGQIILIASLLGILLAVRYAIALYSALPCSEWHSISKRKILNFSEVNT